MVGPSFIEGAGEGLFAKVDIEAGQVVRYDKIISKYWPFTIEIN